MYLWLVLIWVPPPPLMVPTTRLKLCSCLERRTCLCTDPGPAWAPQESSRPESCQGQRNPSRLLVDFFNYQTKFHSSLIVLPEHAANICLHLFGLVCFTEEGGSLALDIIPKFWSYKSSDLVHMYCVMIMSYDAGTLYALRSLGRSLKLPTVVQYSTVHAKRWLKFLILLSRIKEVWLI